MNIGPSNIFNTLRAYVSVMHRLVQFVDQYLRTSRDKRWIYWYVYHFGCSLCFSVTISFRFFGLSNRLLFKVNLCFEYIIWNDKILKYLIWHELKENLILEKDKSSLTYASVPFIICIILICFNVVHVFFQETRK